MKKVFKKLFLIFILFNLFGTTNLMAKKEQYHPLLILEDIQVSYPKKTAVLAEVYYGFLNYIKYTGEKPKLIPIDGDSFYISEKKIYIPTKAFDEIPPESLYYFIGGAFEKDPEGFLERQGKNISRIKPREADFKKDQTEEKNKILETEKLVSKYFVSLYSDIKDMKYIIAEKDDSISYELMCYKTIDSKIIEIPFELESKGTKKLLNLLPLMIDAAMGKTVIIDEIDEGIHDLLVNNLVQNIIESINGQIIFTTHDTYLMEQLPKKSMYIIKSDALGNKTIDSLDKYKIDSNNNPAKMYLNGAFGGTPYPRDLDFEDMAEELNYEE